MHPGVRNLALAAGLLAFAAPALLLARSPARSGPRLKPLDDRGRTPSAEARVLLETEFEDQGASGERASTQVPLPRTLRVPVERALATPEARASPRTPRP